MNKRFLTENIKRFNANCRNFYGKNTVMAWVSEIFCFIRFGCSPDDFFRYEFYKKSNYERDKFITYRRSQRIIHTCNDEKYRTIMDDKAEFNRFFSSFIIRDWIDLRKSTEEELLAFAEKHGEIILKPVCGGQGHGIRKINYAEIIGGGLVLSKYRNYLAEEVICQHHVLNAINNSSVNTIRVWTLNGKILDTALRTGAQGAIVDNLHSDGVCAHINEEHGIVDYPCINNRLEKFIYHPSSNVQLVGYAIPEWEKVIEIAKRAAMMIPEVKYIGWDIAIREDGLELIEGNFDPGHDLMQMITQIGKYEKAKELLKE